MITKIEDINDERVRHFSQLTEAQLRNRLDPSQGIFIAESPTVIEVAIQGGCEPISFLTDERLLRDKVISLSEQFPDVPFYVADRDTLINNKSFYLMEKVIFTSIYVFVSIYSSWIYKSCRGSMF